MYSWTTGKKPSGKKNKKQKTSVGNLQWSGDTIKFCKATAETWRYNTMDFPFFLEDQTPVNTEL